MGVYTRIEAVKPPDETWEKHRDVWEACETAGVEVPKATDDFFDGCRPDPVGVVVELATMEFDSRESHECYAREEVSYQLSGLVDLSKLPPGTKWIRVVRS